MLHEIEHGADHIVVLAQGDSVRHRDVGVSQRVQHPVLAIHGMSGGQQLAGRLAAQHILPLARCQLESRVGLSSGEFLGA